MTQPSDEQRGHPAATALVSSDAANGGRLFVTSDQDNRIPTQSGESPALPAGSHDGTVRLSPSSEAELRLSAAMCEGGSAPLTTSVGCQTTDDEQARERQLARRCDQQEQQLLQHRQLLARAHKQLSQAEAENARLQQHQQLLNQLFEQLQRRDAHHAAAHADSEEEDGDRTEMAPPELVRRVETAQGRREVIHVSRTYLRLRDLILEKRSLLSEIDQLKSFNAQLERRLNRQEHRLSSVAAELQTTWGLVSKLKMQHAQLHTAESVLRYEVREKRRLLERLRTELEGSRQTAAVAREMNAESELEWQRLRQELDERKHEIMHGRTDEEGFTSTPEQPENLTAAIATSSGSSRDDTDSSPVGSPPSSAGRLQDLEQRCQMLYSKVAYTAVRQVELQSKLTQLHDRYGTSESGSSTDTAYASLDRRPISSDDINQAESDTEAAGTSPVDTESVPLEPLERRGMPSETLDRRAMLSEPLEGRGREWEPLEGRGVPSEQLDADVMSSELSNGRGEMAASDPLPEGIQTPSTQLEQHSREVETAAVSRPQVLRPEPPSLIDSQPEEPRVILPNLSVYTISTGLAVETTLTTTLADVVPVSVAPETDEAVTALVVVEPPLVSLPDPLLAINSGQGLPETGVVVTSAVAVTESLPPHGAEYRCLQSPTPERMVSKSDADQLSEALVTDVDSERGRTAGLADDQISRTTSALLEEVATFLARSRSQSDAAPDRQWTQEEVLPTTASSQLQGLSADSSDSESPEPEAGSVSAAGCRLLSLLPERMVHMRHERQRLAERAAQQQQRADRLQRRLARLRLLRRQEVAARRALEQRCCRLQLAYQQQEAVAEVVVPTTADQPTTDDVTTRASASACSAETRASPVPGTFITETVSTEQLQPEQDFVPSEERTHGSDDTGLVSDVHQSVPSRSTGSPAEETVPVPAVLAQTCRADGDTVLTCPEANPDQLPRKLGTETVSSAAVPSISVLSHPGPCTRPAAGGPDYSAGADRRHEFQRAVVDRLLASNRLQRHRSARCQMCQTEFRVLTTRRHHCRLCGGQFCRRCACVLVTVNRCRRRVCVGCLLSLCKCSASDAEVPAVTNDHRA